MQPVIHLFAVLAWIGICLMVLSIMAQQVQAAIPTRGRQFLNSMAEKYLPFELVHDVYSKRERAQRRIARGRRYALLVWRSVQGFVGFTLAMSFFALLTSRSPYPYTFSNFLGVAIPLSLFYFAFWLIYRARLWWLDQDEAITMWNNADDSRPYDYDSDDLDDWLDYE